MNRRGFISKFKSIFSSRSEGDPFFFGVQIVINIYGEDELRQRLHRVIAEIDEVESPYDKRNFYKQIVAILRESQPFFEYGFWDYLTNPSDATEEFHDWVDGMEASMATVGEELGTEIDEVHRMSAEKSYVVVSMAFLLELHRSLEGMVRIVEGVSEEDYFTPYGFSQLLEAINHIDFEYSHGDAIFILPGNDQDGFSWTDMRGEGWEYLKPIMGTIN